MARGRRRRRPLGLAVALALVVTLAAASAAPVAAERQTTITFGGAGSTVVGISPSTGRGDEITVNFAPSTQPLPRKFVIQIPAGYALDLTAKPGTEIADGSLYVVGTSSASLASGYGAVVAQDPSAYLSDPAAQECAPGPHAAVWAFSTSLASQKVDLTIFVDPGGGYTLQSCPTGLGEGGSESAASISLGGLDLRAPRAAGRYVWRAVVTPRASAPYELQAIAPLPESLTLRGRYQARTKTAILTGKLVEGGRPAARRAVFLFGFSGNAGFGRRAQTKADGTFSARIRIKRTTEFTASAAPAGVACEGTAASDRCAGALTVPPEDASATVWVRLRGQAHRAIRAADQRLAERENLAATDFPPGVDEDAPGRATCPDPTNEADLTITGESRRAFIRYVDEPLSAVTALGLTRVFATREQAAAAFAREALLATARCELADLPPGTKVRGLRLGPLPARVRAFRATFSIRT